MSNQDKLKETIDALMKKKGNTKGSELITFSKYITAKYGEEGIKKIESKLKEFGYSFEFDDVKELGEWYSEGLNVSVILIAKEIFGWTKQDFFELGYTSPKYSFLVKILMKYFVTLKAFVDEGRSYWNKFMDVGDFEGTELDEEKKYCVLRLSNYDFHPDMCEYYRGFLLKISENVVKGKNIKMEEVKCIYRSDPYHEYLVSWE